MPRTAPRCKRARTSPAALSECSRGRTRRLRTSAPDAAQTAATLSASVAHDGFAIKLLGAVRRGSEGRDVEVTPALTQPAAQHARGGRRREAALPPAANPPAHAPTCGPPTCDTHPPAHAVESAVVRLDRPAARIIVATNENNGGMVTSDSPMLVEKFLRSAEKANRLQTGHSSGAPCDSQGQFTAGNNCAAVVRSAPSPSFV